MAEAYLYVAVEGSRADFQDAVQAALMTLEDAFLSTLHLSHTCERIPGGGDAYWTAMIVAAVEGDDQDGSETPT
jgi:hypothetical protein